MNINTRLSAIIILALAVLASCTGKRYCGAEGFAQGGVYRITLNTDPSRIQALKQGADSLLRDIDNALSGYNKGSVLTQVNSAAETEVSDPMFIEVLELSRRFWETTGGRFDPASGALFDAWGFGFREGNFPDSTQVDSLLAFTGMEHIRYEEGKVVRDDVRSRLNFNAIAQGYSCDVLARYFTAQGVEDMLVDVGGEIFCKGKNPSGGPWTIGIDAPVDGNMDRGADLESVILVDAGKDGKGVVTSGNYRKFYVRDGRKYAHTVDPKTGYPVEHNLLSATVIANTAAEADAIATYLMVAGLEESRRFVCADDSLEALLIYEEDGAMKIWKSDGIRTRETAGE